jgi:hypothetical protein
MLIAIQYAMEELTMTNQDALYDALANEPAAPVDLTTIRRKAVQLRDAYLEKADLEERVKKVQTKITDIERKDLPDMFSQAGVSSVTVEADRNHPAFVAQRGTVYTAKIPDEKRMDAFEWFEQQGHGDLIKSVINIVFGMQEHEERLRVMKILADNHIPYYTNESIHHQTLKAFVKREITGGRIVPQDLLGVFIFDEVKIK